MGIEENFDLQDDKTDYYKEFVDEMNKVLLYYNYDGETRSPFTDYSNSLARLTETVLYLMSGIGRVNKSLDGIYYNALELQSEVAFDKTEERLSEIFEGNFLQLPNLDEDTRKKVKNAGSARSIDNINLMKLIYGHDVSGGFINRHNQAKLIGEVENTLEGFNYKIFKAHHKAIWREISKINEELAYQDYYLPEDCLPLWMSSNEEFHKMCVAKKAIECQCIAPFIDLAKKYDFVIEAQDLEKKYGFEIQGPIVQPGR